MRGVFLVGRDWRELVCGLWEAPLEINDGHVSDDSSRFQGRAAGDRREAGFSRRALWERMCLELVNGAGPSKGPACDRSGLNLKLNLRV